MKRLRILYNTHHIKLDARCFILNLKISMWCKLICHLSAVLPALSCILNQHPFTPPELDHIFFDRTKQQSCTEQHAVQVWGMTFMRPENNLQTSQLICILRKSVPTLMKSCCSNQLYRWNKKKTPVISYRSSSIPVSIDLFTWKSH